MAVHTSGGYVYGNTARKIAPQVEYVTREEHQVRRNREKAAQRMSLPYVVVLSIAVMLTAIICINYVQMQTTVTSTLKNIAGLEAKYDQLVEDNNALEMSISSYLDYNYIYQVATEELGMQNASQDQIVWYDSVESEYVKQYEDIPNH